jgi:hypothetical protein
MRIITNALGADTRYTDGRKENTNPIEMPETTKRTETTTKMNPQETRSTLGRDDGTSKPS